MFVICVISLVVFLSVSKITKKYMKQNSLKYVNSVNLPKDKMMSRRIRSFIHDFIQLNC